MAVYLGKNKVGVTIENKTQAKQILDGTLTEFDNTKWNLTSLTSYRFYEFENLTKLNLTGLSVVPAYIVGHINNKNLEIVLDENTTEIGVRAFGSDATSYIDNMPTLPKTLIKIGDYAFYNLKRSPNSTSTMELNTINPCEIGNTSFRNCDGVVSIKGNYSKIDNAGFQGCSELETIDIVINGALGQNSFYACGKVNSLNIDGVITSLGSSSFRGFGSVRQNPENNILNIDLSKGTFKELPSYCFAGTSSAETNKYMTIKIPKSVTSISSYVFNNSDNLNVYFEGSTVPTLTSTNAFVNATNIKICVPYNSVNAYKTATNWATYADDIIGYVDRDTFTAGQTLPQYSLEGYALTWYSDIDLTQQVTTAESPSNYYYCTIGAEQVDVVGINSLYQDNCKIAVTNSSTGYEYTEGEGILVGTQLTITATPTIAGYVPYILTFNSVDFTSPYSYTTVSGTNINLVGVYYNGVDIPVRSDLNQNSWAVIKTVVQSGAAGQYWTVGQIKEIEIDGLTYGIRLSDLQAGRYNYASGTKTTNAVFEFVQLYNTRYRMNAANTNAGGWATAELQTTINSTILNKIPMELRSLLEEIVVASANDGASNYTEITTSNNKLFLPCAFEVNLSSSYGRDGEGTTWDYYVDAGESLRIKMKPNTTSGTAWWLRSPFPGNTSHFSSVSSYGYGGGTYATYSTDVCPCFAW